MAEHSWPTFGSLEFFHFYAPHHRFLFKIFLKPFLGQEKESWLGLSLPNCYHTLDPGSLSWLPLDCLCLFPVPHLQTLCTSGMSLLRYGMDCSPWHLAIPSLDVTPMYFAWKTAMASSRPSMQDLVTSPCNICLPSASKLFWIMSGLPRPS